MHPNYNEMGLPPPAKLSKWRRVSLATTKSGETENGVLLLTETNVQRNNHRRQASVHSASAGNSATAEAPPSGNPNNCARGIQGERGERRGSMADEQVRDASEGSNSRESFKRCESSVTKFGGYQPAQQPPGTQQQPEAQQISAEAGPAPLSLRPPSPPGLLPAKSRQAEGMQAEQEPDHQVVERALSSAVSSGSSGCGCTPIPVVYCIFPSGNT